MSSTLAKHIVLEASSNSQIDKLVEQAIDASLGDISFDVLKNNFEEAKKQYYKAVRNYLADKLGVDPYEVGRFVTTDMKQKFAKALQKNYEALQPTPETKKDFTDPQFLNG